MGRADRPVAALERVEAILENRAIYELAALIPHTDRTRGGRRRHYPTYAWLVFEALLSVYGSARQVEAELSHPLVWTFCRDKVRARFPTEAFQWLPEQPMRRHHYTYARNRYLTDPAIFEQLAALHREIAAEQAREVGLLDPNGPGSWTHPDLSRMLHADGKVITPLYKATPGDTKINRRTGEIRPALFEADAKLHFQGDGETAWGTKFVIVAARNEDVHGRIILDVAWVPNHGGEAKTAMECFTRLAPHLPGAQGVIYDTALRGMHHQTLLRDLGLLPVNRVTAAKADVNQPRRNDGRREEKNTRIESKTITLADGTTRTVELYARGGAVGIGELTERGDLHYSELTRVRTHRTRDQSGKFRWYNDYQLPHHYGCGLLTVRLHNTEQDTARKLNRTENVRPIPPTDPDFARLYPRRNDAESINRNLDDTLWLRRAHSIGHRRQTLNLLGYALMVNGLALHRHRRRRIALAA
ncbi:MAG: transposase [Actinomycetota bacterium]|nr:transposase [Actinomycetota bacterium]